MIRRWWRVLARRLGALLLAVLLSNPVVPMMIAQSSTVAPAAQLPRQTTSFVARTAEAVGPSVVRIEVIRDGSITHGSGFVFDHEGNLMTNGHVVFGARMIIVSTSAGHRCIGKLIGLDEATDLAVVQLDALVPRPKPAELGDDHELRVGDWVVAIGSPIGLDNTVTLGIVSSLKRSLRQAPMIPNWGSRVRFIQTDAAINPGNSGGPLCDEFGKVVGINTATASRAQGIGFAVPVSKATRVALALKRGQAPEHPYLGVDLEDNGKAIVVKSVQPNSPAERAGLRVDDRLISLEEQQLRNVDHLMDLVDNARVGGQLSLLVKRPMYETDDPVSEPPANYLRVKVTVVDVPRNIPAFEGERPLIDEEPEEEEEGPKEDEVAEEEEEPKVPPPLDTFLKNLPPWLRPASLHQPLRRASSTIVRPFFTIGRAPPPIYVKLPTPLRLSV